MNNEFQYDYRPPIKSGWNPAALGRGKLLTDRKIAQYVKRGWYSDGFREARRELMAKKRARVNRKGGFVERDGRLIYNPL